MFRATRTPAREGSFCKRCGVPVNKPRPDAHCLDCRYTTGFEDAVARRGIDLNPKGTETLMDFRNLAPERMKSPDWARIYLSKCDEGVTRKGEYVPCEKVAVAFRIDPEEGTTYPVCAYHSRGEMVSLVEVMDTHRNAVLIARGISARPEVSP